METSNHTRSLAFLKSFFAVEFVLMCTERSLIDVTRSKVFLKWPNFHLEIKLFAANHKGFIILVQVEKKRLPSWMTDPQEKKELMAKKMKTSSLFK